MPASSRSSGLARSVLVGPAQGAAHTELAAGALLPGGWLGRHVHSFEEALYVLSGTLLLEIDGHVHRLGGGDYACMPIGVPHTLADGAETEVRWLSVNTPPRRPPDAPVPDTIFAPSPPDIGRLAALAVPLSTPDPLRRLVGHYEGTPPQAEALHLEDPARGRSPAGMDTALLAYSGISVKMLVDRAMGADHLTMFTVDYEVSGAAQAHDHPFEEAYVFLAGTVQAELDGTPYTFTAGDVAFSAVGSVHGFWNDGPDRVRWLETQAPQPPSRHAYRWAPTWQLVAERGVPSWQADQGEGA
ncbi:MAG: cupin domain-containing protein [Chloroflexi bacterium]|nr:cupin domain-containing protein [Chloroflexota bacterium]